MAEIKWKGKKNVVRNCEKFAVNNNFTFRNPIYLSFHTNVKNTTL